MATPRDYQVGTQALQRVVAAEEDAEIPAMWRGMIPDNLVPDISSKGAKAVIDAVDADRAKVALQKA